MGIIFDVFSHFFFSSPSKTNGISTNAGGGFLLPPRRTIGHPSNSSSVSEAVFPGIYPVNSVEK